jgi:L-asparaginase
VGGLPGSDTGELAQAMEGWLDEGKTIVMMTQVPYEGSDMTVYQVGQLVKQKYGLIETYSMTMEAAVTKLMWALGRSEDPAEIRKLFCTSINYDLLF